MILLSIPSWGISEDYPLQDWSELEDDITYGIYLDEKGSAIDVEETEGPSEGESAIKLTTSIKEWGGVWFSSWGDLSNAKVLQFKAKASTPGLVMIQIHDEGKFRVASIIRVEKSGWTDYSIPISSFEKSRNYQDPSIEEDAVMDWSSIQSVSFDWVGAMESSFTFSPLISSTDNILAYTGMAIEDSKLIVQDYSIIDHSMGGVFNDDYGSAISMKVEINMDSKNGSVVSFDYELLDEGWCGSWFPSGHLSQGQNWNGAKEVEIRVFSEEALEIEMAFNDKNNNAYIAPTVLTNGSGWETLFINFDKFSLNDYYQPENSNPGAPLDLSHITNFSLSPRTIGKNKFKVDLVALVK